MNYNPDMSAAVEAVADKLAGTPVLLVIPTGEDEYPLAVEMGYWDFGAERWEGEWRHTCTDEACQEPTAMAGNDPIAWALPPEIDPELHALIAPKLAA